MNWLFPILSLVSQAQPAPGETLPPRGMDPLPMVLVLMFVAMYFFLIAPQRKRQREMDSMLGGLKKGDRVVFGGGIYGTITGISEEKPPENKPRAPKSVILTVEVDKNTKLTVRREAVSHVLSE